MYRHHQHGDGCSPTCSREWDVDERTPTAAYHIIARGNYGKRPKADKPRWWPFAYHGFKQLVNLIGIVVLALVAKKCGLTVGTP